MAEDVQSLVLEQLRAIRADISGLRSVIDTQSSRLDAMQTELRGLTYMLTVSIGSILVEVKELKERMVRVEALT